MDTLYHADKSLGGRLKRKLAMLIARKPAHISGRTRPMITISFDDAPSSAARAGAEILNPRGIKATYFISAGLMGQDSHFGVYANAQEVMDLKAQGHEIACHSYSHIDCPSISARLIIEEVQKNKLALAELGIGDLQTFAYPYGDVSPLTKRVLLTRFLAVRGLHHGVIKTGSDLNQAPAIGIEGADAEVLALQWLAQGQADPNTWLIFYTHDVCKKPSNYGCTPRVLANIIDAAILMDFEFVTFAQGAGLCLSPDLV